jgi:GYF domain 2
VGSNPSAGIFPRVCTARWKESCLCRTGLDEILTTGQRSISLMHSPESFYLHLAGAQQGPYTIPQIDHLLNSGLIAVETLYWCEGLDQWQPVTSLVALRKKPNRWIKPAIAAAVLVALVVPARIFGPVVVDGWHEANQHAFTESAAYWRARDVVRTGLAGHGNLIEFAAFSDSQVTLKPEGVAQVSLRGSVTDFDGKTTRVAWDVPMHFEAEEGEWSGGPAVEVVAP